MKIWESLKQRPKTAAAILIGLVVILFLALRGGGKSSGAATYSNDTQGQLAIAQINSQVEVAKAQQQAQTYVAGVQAAASSDVAKAQAAAAVEAVKIQANAATSVNQSDNDTLLAIRNAERAAEQAKADAVKAASVNALGQQGINGIIKMEATAPVEKLGRNLGYSGAFGAGGLNAWGQANFGKAEWDRMVLAVM